MAKLIIILADLQVPFQDPNYIKVMLKFTRAMHRGTTYRSVEVGQIGDLMDQPEVGRWNKGAAGEYRGTFWSSVRETRKIISEFDFDWIKAGNHDRRVEDYIGKYAPALGTEDSEWNLNSILQIDARRTRLYRKPFEVAPGWMAAHGDEGSLSPVSGRTAYGLAQRWNTNVICGHTHRAGTVSVTVGLPGNRRRITGLEIGNGMLEESATYIKSGSPNWQKAFAMLVVERGRTYDHLIMMDSDCSFEWNGKIYRP